MRCAGEPQAADDNDSRRFARRAVYPGVKAVFGGRANILQLDANFCAPLVEHVDRNAGVAGTERCQIINDYVFARVRALRPQIVLVGAYFESSWTRRLGSIPASSRRSQGEQRGSMKQAEVPSS